MTTGFPVTITTAEELRLLEEHEWLTMQLDSTFAAAVFDDFDTIRAHGLGVKFEEPNDRGCCVPNSVENSVGR